MFTGTNFGVLVLAAGKGKRMGIEEPKVLKKIGDKPIVFWVLENLKKAGLDGNVWIVLGHRGGEVRGEIEKGGFKVHFCEQTEQKGTAHATKIGLEAMNKEVEHVLVMYGDDSGLYKDRTLVEFVRKYFNSQKVGMVVAARRESPTVLGGLDVDNEGNVMRVMERQEVVDRKLSHHLVLCGAMCFKRSWLQAVIDEVGPSEYSGEYPLPGVIDLAYKQGNPLSYFELEDPKEWTSVNTPEELKEAQSFKLQQTNT